ncbi:MAG TPA: NADH-quinone oxidoreductase subunit H, partial [Clostridiales bacterium]|nr:NADH-quinone oxidoreductase subunit H [Clostridiales bacterium]HOL92068.1 NADH-quinone oxidoreductase subunit H [Clostridiales bacterium]
MLLSLFKILVFPGLIFLAVYALLCEYIDRKVYARLQNRMGPPWYQPLADFLKLLGKETIIPADANRSMFQILPVISLSAVAAAFIYVPVLGASAVYSFEGDLIVVLYLLTIPTMCEFLGGWYSRSVYSTIGSVRTLTQMFAYEVPLFMALLAPALIAKTWSVTGMTSFYSEHPLYVLFNIPAFLTALIAVQGKLERAPFDSPEAETEIVSGALVEYSGKLLALFRMSMDCELVVMASLISAIFLPFMTGIVILDFILYFAKTLAVLLVLTLMRAAMARLRVDQMVNFCW